MAPTVLRLISALALLSVAAAPNPVLRDSFGDPLPAGAVARLGSSRFRHPNSMITYLAISPDNARVASMGGIPETRLLLWDRKTGKLLGEWDYAEDMAWSLRFTPDSKGLIACHGILWYWDLTTGNRRRFLPRVEDAESVHFSPDGTTVVVLCLGDRGDADPSLRVCDLASGKERFTITSPDKTTAEAACFTPSGEIVFGSRRGLHLWDITGKKELQSVKLAFSPRTIAVSPDGKAIAAQGYNQEVVILHRGARPRIVKTSVKGDFRAALTFSPDNREVWFAPLGGPVVALDAATGKQTRAVVPIHDEVSRWRFSAQRDLAVRFAERQFLAVHDLKTGVSGPRFDDHRDGAVLDVAVSPDGTSIATQSASALRIWTFPTGKLLRTIPGKDFLPGLQWTARGDALSVGTASGKILRVDPGTGKRIAEAVVYSGTLLEASVLPDGKRASLMVLAKDGAHRPLVAPLTGKGKPEATALLRDETIVSPEGDRAFVPHREKNDELVGQLVHLGTGQTIWKRPIPGYSKAIFTPDGSRLILADRATTCLDPATGAVLRNGLERNTLKGRLVTFLAVSADGRCYVFGSRNIRHLRRPGVTAMFPDMGTRLVVVEAATGQIRQEFASPERVIRATFSPDGRYLISSGLDGTALVWDLSAIIRGPLPPHAWDNLAAPGRKGHAALCTLAEHPTEAVRLLRAHLAVRRIDPKAVAHSLAALDSESFEERQNARTALAALREDVEGTLRDAVLGATVEVRSRIQGLLQSIESDPQVWRRLRAVELLERIATPDAVALLKRLAGGYPGSALTREARAALRRLRR